MTVTKRKKSSKLALLVPILHCPLCALSAPLLKQVITFVDGLKHLETSVLLDLGPFFLIYLGQGGY